VIIRAATHPDVAAIEALLRDAPFVGARGDDVAEVYLLATTARDYFARLGFVPVPLCGKAMPEKA
jgi:N-acetylglutamate synthase-like GNAT family acetyltransferase